jgi:gliding motility-associated-like protein
MVVKTQDAKAQITDTVCAGIRGEVYRVKPTPGSRYFWTVSCGQITSTQPADSAVVDWCNQSGSYTISVIEVTAKGCVGDSVRAVVKVVNGLHVSISGPKVICAGDRVMLQASGALHYRWNTGATDPEIWITPQDSITEYRVIGYDGRCTPDSAKMSIRVIPRPIALFSHDPPNPLIDDKVTFHFEGSKADDWEWHIDNTVIDGKAQDPSYTFNHAGEQSITLVARNALGCTDSMTFLLKVGSEAHIYVPSVFTPNNDNLNDYFKPVCLGIKSLKMQIFNGWGERIYSAEGLDAFWDGKFHNAEAQEGAYMYMIQAQDINLDWHYLEGTITLLR